MNKVMDMKEAVKKIKSGSSIMVGGFNISGVPSDLIEALITERNAKDLTIINIDTGVTGSKLHKLMIQGRTKKVIATHFGNNDETIKRIAEGSIEYELVPQGTFAERIRIGGSGLGGFLTPVGIGTIVEEGKQKFLLGGKSYILELPLRADIALIHAKAADELGNLYMVGTARNTNEIMAGAADYVIAEAITIVKSGEIDPNLVTVPSVYVDVVVKVVDEHA